MQRNFRTPYWPTAAMLAMAGAIISAGLWTLLSFSAEGLRSEASISQRNRARDVATILEKDLRLSAQLARSAAALIGPLRDKTLVELSLERLLTSASPQAAYGLGIWFEPNQFAPGVPLFGPYVHRDRSSKTLQPILTYEWNTPAYNYPRQGWYQSGMAGRGEPVFVEPYFDTDLVYSTVAVSFGTPGQPAQGVASVDFNLLQLNEIIAKSNTGAHEFIYITTAAGSLLAHPHETAILEWARRAGRRPVSLLDMKAADLSLFQTTSQTPAGDRFESTVPLELGGWSVHISTDSAYLFERANQIRDILYWFTALVWLGLAGFGLVRFRVQRLQEYRRDTLERQRRQEELGKLEAQQRQTQKLESIGTLASGVAHEINNPVMSIMNHAELIVEETKQPEVADRAKRILVLSKRITDIVRHLLTFSRQEREEHSPAGVRDIVDGTLPLIEGLLRKEGIKLTVDIPEDLPKLKCRSQQIQQVILNLLNNARDAVNARYPYFNDNKIIKIEVRPFERANNQWLRILVEDHGKGMPPEIIPRIFDPFFTTKPKDKGTGLGLSISHGIVHEHHGEMRVESLPDEYTRFYVELRVDNGWSLKPQEDSEHVPHTAG